MMALSIGNIIAHPLSDAELGMKGIHDYNHCHVIGYLIGVFSTLKWTKLLNFNNAPSTSSIENVKIVLIT